MENKKKYVVSWKLGAIQLCYFFICALQSGCFLADEFQIYMMLHENICSFCINFASKANEENSGIFFCIT